MPFASHPRAGREIAIERADDPAGDGSGELPKRRADRQHRLALAAACPNRRTATVAGTGALHAHDGEIAERIGPDEGGVALLAIGQDHLESGPTAHDVLVGDDVAGAVDDESRAAPGFDLGLTENPLSNCCSLMTVTTAGMTRSTIFAASKVTTYTSLGAPVAAAGLATMTAPTSSRLTVTGTAVAVGGGVGVGVVSSIGEQPQAEESAATR